MGVQVQIRQPWLPIFITHAASRSEQHSVKVLVALDAQVVTAVVKFCLQKNPKWRQDPLDLYPFSVLAAAVQASICVPQS